jgi:hypothetical protein
MWDTEICCNDFYLNVMLFAERCGNALEPFLASGDQNQGFTHSSQLSGEFFSQAGRGPGNQRKALMIIGLADRF